MSEKRQYDNEYKVQAIKLSKKEGAVKTAEELGIPVNTLYGWISKAKNGGIDIGLGERSPKESLNIAEENQQLKKQLKAMEKEIILIIIKTLEKQLQLWYIKLGDEKCTDIQKKTDKLYQ